MDVALLPFKPMAMKVLQCSFLSGIKLVLLSSLNNLSVSGVYVSHCSFNDNIDKCLSLSACGFNNDKCMCSDPVT